ncbi:MAG: hypothetical protein Q4F58_02345 [Candidatus Saccharibacteria bacterium]|nr:hypothetical protein [Candidatus Saccharibacteria bacterium]
MEKINILGIYRSGVITIESRLDQEYYEYTTGKEDLAYDRISEVICDIQAKLKTVGNFEIYLDKAIKIDEGSPTKPCHQLMVVVNGINRQYASDDIRFEEDLLKLATNLTIRLVSLDQHRTRVDSGHKCIIVTSD